MMLCIFAILWSYCRWVRITLWVAMVQDEARDLVPCMRSLQSATVLAVLDKHALEARMQCSDL